MIALVVPTGPRPRPGGFKLGQRVQLEWPANLYHGARGVVETLHGDWVGVTWSMHGDTFYVPMPARRLRGAKGGRS